ncbi:MAG: AI-2E family transporter [Candidatus Moranbacteria bacterium]|nr:AI-2E family transporter [Candidatus Moranbacteria bacterium]
MRLSNFNTTYFLSLLLIASVSVLVLFIPFLIPIVIAGVFATLFYPLYEFSAKKMKMGEIGGSLFSCLIIIFLVVIPCVATIGLVTKEVRSTLSFISDHPEFLDESMQYIRSFIAKTPFIDEDSISSLFQRSGELFVSVVQKTYSGIAQFFFALFIMFFSLFYFFMDGKKIVKVIMDISPLRTEQEKILIKEFISISKATLKGTIVIGIIQGVLGGLLFLFTGVPSPMTWGVVMIILSIIPVIGSWLVWIPVGVGMILSGAFIQGIIILLFGALIISSIDNILRPKLVGRDSQMHPLFVLFATIGGIISFGVIGFIIGPIIVALFLALLRMYEQEFAQQLKSYNKDQERI